MTPRCRLSRVLPATLLLFVPAAHAHLVPGDASGLHDGLLHPLSGLDHLLAMVAVGLWAAQRGGAYRWLVPLSFVAVMTLGGAVGLAGLAGPGTETVIALSVIMLGLAVAAAARFSLPVSCLVVGLFAFAHGLAHAAEMAPAASALAYHIGFAFSTAGLHAAGLLAGAAMLRSRPGYAVRVAGMLILLVGVSLWLT